jgi:hypothetical protein
MSPEFHRWVATVQQSYQYEKKDHEPRRTMSLDEEVPRREVSARYFSPS